MLGIAIAFNTLPLSAIADDVDVKTAGVGIGEEFGRPEYMIVYGMGVSGGLAIAI